MSIQVTSPTGAYGSYEQASINRAKEEQTASTLTETKEQETAARGVAYEKSGDVSGEKKAGYSVNRMSKEDRAALVQQMKSEQANRKQQLAELVHKMLSSQAGTYGKANNIRGVLSGGNFTVDAATRAQAKKDISEDGYWGVRQTSQRLFDFASALAGDDVDKMREMQKAMEKGFKLAGGTWGRKLPGICYETMEAAGRLFDDYYKSKEAKTADTAEK